LISDEIEASPSSLHMEDPSSVAFDCPKRFRIYRISGLISSPNAESALAFCVFGSAAAESHRSLEMIQKKQTKEVLFPQLDRNRGWRHETVHR
jgi:hypothetical protein